MSFDVSDILLANCWDSKLIDHGTYLTPAGENIIPCATPDAASSFIPVELYEYPYKGNGFDFVEAQNTQIDLLNSTSCLPMSPKCEDVGHTTRHSKQSTVHNDNTDTTPLCTIHSRQIRIRSSNSGASGRAESRTGPKAHNQERKRISDKRQAHSIIERRYRDKVNNKLKELYFTLLEAKHRIRSRTEASDCVVMSEPSTSKKSDVINDAINYIHESEINFRHMADEIQSLRTQINDLENKKMA
ncbi:uncharacterized protein A1O5_13172 [Cladophialophora psammophila CBS 110553]|uniref:BHLH domain-containing protein n=1 Tax=Cladophialophora psammophila CBS 110553 TaxID=1182543 RepID=W9VKQ4_9EURO|nr:uncharacterized protein A1O5_13172 [Cladophialophora psammophila CBS 110553]EXJ53605.1 hypothetical protein A1O5_13172 [Cladophialophora psammophila CBS 110553]